MTIVSHSLWQVWPPWPWPWPPSAPPSIFFSKWRFSHLQAPAAAATLLLDPKRLRAFIPGWQGNNSRSTCTSSWAVVWGWWHRRRIKWWWGGGRGQRRWRWSCFISTTFHSPVLTLTDRQAISRAIALNIMVTFHHVIDLHHMVDLHDMVGIDHMVTFHHFQNKIVQYDGSPPFWISINYTIAGGTELY